MAVHFTEDQQLVIDTRDSSLLVSAAAGSGKTAVLVERIIQLITDPVKKVDIDQLLVVTFTNAAAAQMREKIANALALRLAQEPENEWLQRQSALVHHAQICTIDSFCLSVLRNNFNEIGLDPGFRIAEEGEVKLLEQEALLTVLEQCYGEQSDSFLQMTEMLSSGKRDTRIEDIIQKFYYAASGNPWPRVWIKQHAMDFALPEDEAERKSALFVQSWFQTGIAQLLEGLESALSLIKRCEKLTSQPDGPYMYGELVESEREMIEQLIGRIRHVDSYETAYEIMGTIPEWKRLPSKKDDSVDPGKREQAKNLRNAVKDEIGALAGQYFCISPERFYDQMEACDCLVRELGRVTLLYMDELEHSKREQGILDFSDMEHLALQILIKEPSEDGPAEIRPTETALEYRGHFYAIMIDEYQDSNLVQEYLLSVISGEEDGIYNRFMVGDVKQSIYRFRLARPELFLQKYEEYQSAPGVQRRIDLHRNFRSREEVLSSVNGLFYKLMGKGLGGIEYDELAALNPGAFYPREDYANFQTELLIITEGDGEEELKKKEREALGVAMRIEELVGEQYVTVPEQGQEAAKLRKAEYGDIVILLRSLSDYDEIYARILKERGIPVYIPTRSGYFATYEIRTILNYLRIIANPLQDIPFYGVLTSLIGGFTDQEVATVRALCKERKYLYQNCRAFAELEEEDAQNDSLRNKMQCFLLRFEQARKKAVYMPIHELLRSLLDEISYRENITAMPGGDQRLANVEMLLHKASDFEKTSFYGLYHFIRYMEQLEKYEVDYGEAGLLDEGANAVRIMSIHKSKGLEFPICIVGGMAKGFNLQDSNAGFLIDSDEGVGMNLVDPAARTKMPTLRRYVLSERMKRDNLAEELRVLYVALTRAKEKLILAGAVDRPDKRLGNLLDRLQYENGRIAPYSLLKSGSMLDWVLQALVGERCLSDFAGEMARKCAETENTADDITAEDASQKEDSAPNWDCLTERLKEYEEEASSNGWESPDLAIRMMEPKDIAISDLKQEIDHEMLRIAFLQDSLSLSKEQEEEMHRIESALSKRLGFEYPYSDRMAVPVKVSVSELKHQRMHEADEGAAQLFESREREKPIPSFEKEEEVSSGTFRGNAYHKVMELFDFKRLVGCMEQQISSLLTEELDRMVLSGLLYPEYRDAVSVRKLTRFLSSETAMRMAIADEKGLLWREQPFMMGIPASEVRDEYPQDETVLVQGIIDVFWQEENGIVLLDYKTDRVNTAKELVGRYEEQLILYQEAIEKTMGIVSEKLIYSYGLEQTIAIGSSYNGLS